MVISSLLGNYPQPQSTLTDTLGRFAIVADFPFYTPIEITLADASADLGVMQLFSADVPAFWINLPQTPSLPHPPK